MLRIAIVDDEMEILNITKIFVNNYFSRNNSTSVIKCFNSSVDFLKSDHSDIDVILLDIEMPMKNGIQVAVKLRQTNKFVYLCFITGYERYISESYKIHAFEYLLKPITQEKIDKLFDEILLYMDNSIKSESKLSFTTTKGKLTLGISKYIYFEYIDSSNTYINRCTKLVTSNGIFIIKDKISNVFEILKDDCFVVPHRSFIINFENVKLIKQNMIIMNNNDVIPLSQKRAKVIKEMFNAYIIKSIGGLT